MSAPQTPAMKQWHAFKAQCPDAFLFFRIGDFYELFYDDATTVAPLLGLALTARNKGAAAEAAMCGVPHHQLENYAAKLVRLGRKVAVCDQVEDARFAKGVVKRAITRVITPGAATLDSLLEPGRGNYTLALAPPDPGSRAGVAGASRGWGGALLEVTTGDFRVFAADDGRALAALAAPFAPSELLLPEPPRGNARPLAPPEEFNSLPVTRRPETQFHPDLARDALAIHFGVAGLEGFGIARDHAGLGAAGALLAYARETQAGIAGPLTRLRPLAPEGRLQVDPASLRNLEVLEGSRGGRVGSLLEALDETKTPGGARLLAQTLAAPPNDLAAIAARHGAVGELCESGAQRATLRQLLGEIRDLERLAGKCAFGRANPRDLAALRASLRALPALKAELAASAAKRLEELSRLDPHDALAARLVRELSEEPPALLADGGTIAAGVDGELDELRALQTGAHEQLTAIETRERLRTSIASLKVRFNSVFGYYLEVSRANLDKVPADYQRRQTTVGGERFITPELKALEEKLLSAGERIAALEARCFAALAGAVRDAIAPLQETAARVSELDLLCAFAEGAARHDFVRPEMGAGGPFSVEAGRHPVVERLTAAFTPNDLALDPERTQIALLTGPNMGGKSTWLKQSGLIALMAHAGSFVPARAARVPRLTRLHTRVGAGDDLLTGRSTFMVEMAETAAILHGADANSLVLLDEVGRGTATHDGLALAWAITEALHDAPAAKRPLVLFATHYHELTELAQSLDRLKNFRVAVAEHGHELVFLRRIEPGAADRSYGIQVARLAGLPAPVLARAREVLANLERAETGADGRTVLGRHEKTAAARPGEQPLLFAGGPGPAERAALEGLRDATLDDLTPRQAHELLAELQRRLQG